MWNNYVTIIIDFILKNFFLIYWPIFFLTHYQKHNIISQL